VEKRSILRVLREIAPGFSDKLDSKDEKTLLTGKECYNFLKKQLFNLTCPSTAVFVSLLYKKSNLFAN
jgi:hypothetical protein